METPAEREARMKRYWEYVARQMKEAEEQAKTPLGQRVRLERLINGRWR